MHFEANETKLFRLNVVRIRDVTGGSGEVAPFCHATWICLEWEKRKGIIP